MGHFEELEALDPRGYVGPRIETPTPHKIAVLILVQQYLKAKKAATDSGFIYPAQSRKHFCMLLLKLIQYPDMTYNDLHHLLTSARYKIDTLHLELFEKTMSDLFTLGIELLFEFAGLQNYRKLLAEELGVSQFSNVGLYVRRVGVILERLSFPEIMALYKNICLYYEKGVRSLAIGPRRPAASSASLNRNDTQSSSDDMQITNKDSVVTIAIEESILDTDTVHQDRNLHCKWSPKQADLFVTQQSNLLESNELRALPPTELQTKLYEIIQDNPLNSQAYFLGYMNQLRLRDVFGAIDALHRSFDRSPLQLMNQYDQKGFQYFSVNLAVLHAVFSHRHEAINALKECIMLAQECGDKRCLDLANSWYCLLNGTHIDPIEKSLPDMNDPCLVQSLSQAIQFVVKFGALCGYLPLDLFELLLKSDDLNTKNFIIEHVADSLALRSSLWCLYGRHEMSSLYSQLLLNLKMTWPFGDIGNSESISKVLASFSLWLHVQGELHLSTVVLHHSRERFTRHPNAASWMLSYCNIHIRTSIYRCRWQEALRMCCQLYLLSPDAGNLQRAEVLIARRYFNIARKILNRILRSKNLDILTQVRVLILLAYTTMSHRQYNSSSETIDLLMRASVLTEAAYMDYEHALVDMILAQALLQMGLYQKAFQSINNCIDQIHTNGGIYDRARADFMFVQCLIATARSTEEARKFLMQSVSILERAATHFKRLEAHAKVLDIYRYLSKIFHQLGDSHSFNIEQRNKYACHFKHYHQEFPIAKEFLGQSI